MHNIDSQYLDLIIPGFNALPLSIQRELNNLDFWSTLVMQIGKIEEECVCVSWWGLVTIDRNMVKMRLRSSTLLSDQELKPITQAIQIERYPFLKFLHQQNPAFINFNIQQIAQKINELKDDYFRYRFANIYYLGPNDECLAYWNQFFNIPNESINSLESLHDAINLLEKGIVENWIFSHIHSIMSVLLQNNHFIRQKIRNCAMALTQDCPQENALDMLLFAIKNEAIQQHLCYKLPPDEHTPNSLFDIFKRVLGTLCQNIPLEVAEISDVHAIIQASGFSTQNEHSHLAILDFINYIQYAEEIKNVKSILNAFLRPLLPLYWELVYLSKQPKNLSNITRLILPLILLTAYLIAIETLFLTIPLANTLYISAIAMIFSTTISIYLGLVCLSYLYENAKILDQKLTEWWYGGRYQTPIYQVNARMNAIFGEGLAQKVGQFYIKNMQELDMNIANLEKKKHITGLNLQEISCLKHAHAHRKKIEIEWMGIHHLHTCATDETKTFVKCRLKEKIDEKFELYKSVQASDAEILVQLIHRKLCHPALETSIFKPDALKIKRDIEDLKTFKNAIK